MESSDHGGARGSVDTVAATSDNGPRKAAEGDVPPDLTPGPLEDYLADEAAEEAS